MSLNLEAAISIANTREQELTNAGWDKTPAEAAALRAIADYAWLWRRFELTYPSEAAAFRAGVDVSVELRRK